jgi:hypothetical protein
MSVEPKLLSRAQSDWGPARQVVERLSGPCNEKIDCRRLLTLRVRFELQMPRDGELRKSRNVSAGQLYTKFSLGKKRLYFDDSDFAMWQLCKTGNDRREDWSS